MYINNSELCDFESLIGLLDGALERNPTNFIEGYRNVKDIINKASETSDKIRKREVNKMARKIVKERLGNKS